MESYNLHWDSHEPKVRVPRTTKIQSQGKTLNIEEMSILQSVKGSAGVDDHIV